MSSYLLFPLSGGVGTAKSILAPEFARKKRAGAEKGGQPPAVSTIPYIVYQKKHPAASVSGLNQAFPAPDAAGGIQYG